MLNSVLFGLLWFLLGYLFTHKLAGAGDFFTFTWSQLCSVGFQKCPCTRREIHELRLLDNSAHPRFSYIIPCILFWPAPLLLLLSYSVIPNSNRKIENKELPPPPYRHFTDLYPDDAKDIAKEPQDAIDGFLSSR